MNVFAESKTRIKLNALPRKTAVKGGKNRRFQVDLEPRGTLAGEDLVRELAKYGFVGECVKAEMALMLVEGFIAEKLSEGYRLDLKYVTFSPRLSGALSTRDADPETDGLYVQGAVSARGRLRHLLRNKIEAVNPESRKVIRILRVVDETVGRVDEIAAGHVLSITGQDIEIDKDSPDEGFWLEKRIGGHFNRSRFIQRAEIVEMTPLAAKIVFREPIRRGEYNLVVATRCGEGHDHTLRRVGHLVTVV